MPYAKVGLNCMAYVDRIIKLMEKVPELLAIIGFLKSCLIFEGYKISFDVIKIKRTIPIAAHEILRYGW